MLVSTHTDPGSGFTLHREGVNTVGWLEISRTIKRKDKTSRVKDKKIRLRILEGKDNCLTVNISQQCHHIYIQSIYFYLAVKNVRFL